MSTISTPSGVGVPGLTANGAVPNRVWQAVNLANGKEGRNVLLALFLHNSCVNGLDSSIENKRGEKHTKSLNKEGEMLDILYEVVDFKSVGSTRSLDTSNNEVGHLYSCM